MNEFVAFKYRDDSVFNVNARYITSFAYCKEEDQTLVTVLGEISILKFPGDQTNLITCKTSTIQEKNNG